MGISITNAHELHNTLNYLFGAVAAPTDNTAVNSVIVDVQGYSAIEFVIMTGTLADADATFAVTMQHGDQSNLGDAANVDAESLVGTLAAASFTFADDNAIKSVGYKPGKGATKRYVRLTVTPSANASAAPINILVVRKPNMV